MPHGSGQTVHYSEQEGMLHSEYTGVPHRASAGVLKRSRAAVHNSERTRVQYGAQPTVQHSDGNCVWQPGSEWGWRRIWRAQGLKQQQRKVQQQEKAELEAVEARGRGLPRPEGEPKVRWKAIWGPLGKRRKGRPELGDRYQEQQVHQLQV